MTPRSNVEVLRGTDLLSSGLYVAELEREMFHHEWPLHWPALGYWTFPVTELVLRDANGRDGEWPAAITLPYIVAEVDHDGRTVVVPCWAPDPERAAWRRRPWWGSRSGASMPMWRL